MRVPRAPRTERHAHRARNTTGASGTLRGPSGASAALTAAAERGNDERGVFTTPAMGRVERGGEAGGAGARSARLHTWRDPRHPAYRNPDSGRSAWPLREAAHLLVDPLRATRTAACSRRDFDRSRWRPEHVPA